MMSRLPIVKIWIGHIIFFRTTPIGADFPSISVPGGIDVPWPKGFPSPIDLPSPTSVPIPKGLPSALRHAPVSVPTIPDFHYHCRAPPSALPRAKIEKWYGRAIYFIVTDRFARSEPSSDTAPVCAGVEWCGGTFRGIQRHLDYIQNMGFDAIWITPVVKQVDWRDKYGGTAYHGYWASDFTKIDHHYGTEEELLNLRRACKNRGMLFMLDVVANHVGPIGSMSQVQQLGPHLNGTDGHQFHQLYRNFGETFSQYIQHPVQANDAFDKCGPDFDFRTCDNMIVTWNGWMGDLGDLNQESKAIESYLQHYISDLATKYQFDGFRLDTALYMPGWFIQCFQQAGGTFMIGEVRTPLREAHHRFDRFLSGLLNFPVTFGMAEPFGKDGSMTNFHQLLQKQKAMGYADENLLGNFVDNHDQDRFLYTMGGDVSRLKNGLTWTMLYHGIPIIYQGTEQVEVAKVANEPDMRRSLWPNFGKSELYIFLTELNALRKEHGFAAGGKDVTTHAEIVTSSAKHLAFVRGQLLVLLTNAGQGQQTKFCLKLNLLPSPWNNVCHNTEAHIVLGNASNPECVEDNVCLDSVDGCPSVYAVREHPVLLVF